LWLPGEKPSFPGPVTGFDVFEKHLDEFRLRAGGSDDAFGDVGGYRGFLKVGFAWEPGDSYDRHNMISSRVMD